MTHPIRAQAEAIADTVTAYRRDFHRHPELGYHETRTAGIVADRMRELGYSVQTGVARTGVVAERGEGRPVIAIRADMDALPVHEAGDLDYASTVPGVMHACGHDAHTAIALGVAELLAQAEFPGTVRFLFQPAEEIDDDEGFTGASRMIQAGAVEGVDAIIGLHVMAEMETGTIRSCADTFLAGADLFRIKVIGRGGHGGAPHLALDPINLTAQVVVAVNAIVSRRVRSTELAVITIGTIHGGEADNVIPESVEMAGTMRYANQAIRETLHVELENACSVARALGGDYDLEITAGSGPTINDPAVVEQVLAAAEDIVGPERIAPHEPVMYGDDFSRYCGVVPASYFFVGAAIEGDKRRHHDPRFDIDEACLPVGVAVMTEAALRLLKSPPRNSAGETRLK